jgi:hypothetical protein
MESTMKARLLLPLLFVSALCVSPASANWFSNPDWNINLNVGSAPNPTPGDIQAGARPVLVRDADGNVIAMVDPQTGKVLAIAEPVRPPAPALNAAAANKAPSTAPVR